MRQAGVLAAAGIVSFEQMVDRLAEDHETSKQLAHGLADYPQIDINVDRVVTNMVMFSLRNSQQEPLSETETEQFLTKASAHGVLMGHIGQGKIRAVTHYGINTSDITAALTAIRRALIDLQL
jgi:threonine aldolase